MVEACRSTCFWGLLVGILKHAATCRSTLKIGLRLFGKKVSDRNINSISEQSFGKDGLYSSGQMVHL